MKRFKIISVALLSIFGMLLGNSCSSNVPNDSKIREIYELAKNSGFEGTYEEWLESIRGEDGKDGHSPVVTIGSNGNWFIDGNDTGIKAKGEDGAPGKDGVDGEDGQDGAQGPQGEPGKDGKSIVSVDFTTSVDNVDVYTITYSDGSSSIFKVTNGIDGATGEQGIQGIQGEPGKDGHTPEITIGENGNWFIDGVDTKIKAQGPQGPIGPQGPEGKPGQDGEDGRSIVSIKLTSSKDNVDTYTITYSDKTTSNFTVTNGIDGATGEQGIQGIQGEPGKDGHTPEITIGENGNWFIDGVDTKIKAQGPQGPIGPQGPEGKPGQDGEDGRSIISIELTSSKDNVDTYTITYSDGTFSNFTVTNGQDGNPGKDGFTPVVEIGENGNWIINGQDTGVKAKGDKGNQGVSISKIEKTSTEGNKDIYTIYFSNGETSNFEIINGNDGKTAFSNTIVSKGNGRVFTKQGSYFVGDEIEFIFEPEIGYELRTLRINNEIINLDLDINYTIDSKTNVSSYKTNMVEFGFFVEAEFKESSNLIIKEPTEVIFWTNKGGNELNWFKEKIATLKTIEPNLEIKLEQISAGVNDYISQINDKMNSILAPTLVTLPSKNVFPFELENLNDFIWHQKYGIPQEEYDDIKTSSLIKSTLDENKMQGILIDNSYSRMYYNETAVEQLVQNVPGLEMLDESTIGNISMEDFLFKICPSIKEYNESLPSESKLYDDSQEYSSILSVDFRFNFFEELSLKTGGFVEYDEKGNRKFLFNNSLFIEELTRYKQAMNLGYINKFSPTYTSDKFIKNNSLFGLNSSSGSGYYFGNDQKFRTSVTNVPYTYSADEVKYASGNQLSILSNANNEKKLGAWVALKYFTNYENSLDYTLDNHSYLPRKSQKNDEAYKNYINENINLENSVNSINAKIMSDMNEDETIQTITATTDNRSLDDGAKIEDFFKWFSNTDFTREQLETKLTELENSLGN